MCSFQCWLKPNPFPTTPKTGQSKCCPNRLSICPGWTTASRFIGGLNHNLFWKLSGCRQMCTYFPLFTWRLRQDDRGRARQDPAAAAKPRGQIWTVQTQSCQRQPSYACPGMAPFHIFRQRLSLWLTLKYRGGSTDKTRDSVFNISRRSKIDTAFNRLIVTKWWIERG